MCCKAVVLWEHILYYSHFLPKAGVMTLATVDSILLSAQKCKCILFYIGKLII